MTQTVGSNTHTTSYAYDIEEGGYIKNRVTDAEGRVTEAWFDPMGRKIKDNSRGDTGDSIVMQASYTYDNNFRVSIVTRNDGTKEKYTYNSMDLMTRHDYYEASESTESDSNDYIEYVYDDNGNMTRESVYHGTAEETATYTYNNMGRVLQMTQGDLQNGGVSVNYTYDGAGKVTEISYTKDGTLRKLGYVYDGYGRIHYITLALGSAAADIVREYVYKTNGDLDYTKDFREFESDGADYIKTAYEINSAGLTTKVTYTDYEDGAGSGTKKEEYTMTYDDRGYITAETAYTNYGTAQTVNKSFAYDSIGRLTQATIGSKTKNYTYDKVGNRLSMSDGTDSVVYSYNQFNQLTSMTKNSQNNTTYTYDGRGNQTQEVQQYFGITTGGITTYYNRTTDYSYDLMNNMAQADISTPEADQQGNVTYTNETSINAYNASGQRIKRVENGETTNYYYSGGATLFTANANNWLLTENVIDLNGQIITSARFDDQNPSVVEGFYFYHYDMRGSTTAIIQPDGTLIKGYSYDEFGNLESSGASNFLNDVTFTGSVSDKSTGLQYMNSRFYNPNTSRFLSQDTYTGNPYDPWTQHLYSYCGNNPTNFIDPTGHSSKSLAELRSDLKFRQKLVAGYTRLVQNCNNASMLDLYIYGRERNKGIVMDLKAEIAKLITKDLSDTQREEVMATIEEVGWDNVEIGDEGMSVYTGGTSVMCVLTPQGATDYTYELGKIGHDLTWPGIASTITGFVAGVALTGPAALIVGAVCIGAGVGAVIVGSEISRHIDDLKHFNNIAESYMEKDGKGAVFSATIIPSGLTGVSIKFDYYS